MGFFYHTLRTFLTEYVANYNYNYKLSTEHHWNKALLTIDTLDLHKWNQNEFRICSHAHRCGGKCSYRVFIGSGNVTNYLYATFFCRIWMSMMLRQLSSKTHIYNKMTCWWQIRTTHFISVITQQCVHAVGQSLHFNNSPCAHVSHP